MSFSRSQGDARKRHVRFADSALVGSLAEIHEYEVSECPQIPPRTFDECCEELLERMDIPDLAVRNSALSHVQGRVLHLATTWRGSHVVKRALEIARREEQEALVRGLHGHVLELALSSLGSQVLQWCLQLLPARSVHFIFAEIVASAPSVAQHDFGHGVICRIIENMPIAETVALADTLLGFPGGFSQLSKDVNGQAVVKSLLDYGPPAAQECIRHSLSTCNGPPVKPFALGEPRSLGDAKSSHSHIRRVASW
uniref:RNA-binding protein of the Puf family-like, translational repressor n=1 Tax=Noctiluca scintillans TaxID=2966 RepID=A7WQ54_NOCSC|nr:RNA-binding protein of the Puf family-like, translational repressor [Noctiluca scintillans]